jgi:hypothetical protein
MNPSQTYTFPLETKGAIFRRPQYDSVERPSPKLLWPWSYLAIFGAPLLVVVLAFSFGAGASLADLNIMLHPANVFIVWLLVLSIYVLIGLLWSVLVEQRINRFFFERWGTQIREDPFNRVYWMAPLAYLIMATTDTFLVAVPAIQWPKKNYSYWMAVFRGLIKGFGVGGVQGLQTAYTVPYWPLELAFIGMLVSSIQTMVACTTVVGIAEAMNLTQVHAAWADEANTLLGL